MNAVGTTSASAPARAAGVNSRRRPLPADLPPEVRELIEPHLEPDLQRLDTIGKIVLSSRQAAKDARQASGIELVWAACEEAYVGIDDANRAEFGAGRWTKPQVLNGPVSRQTGATPGSDPRSSVYIPISRRYAAAGAAKVGEILLPADEKAFALSETPVPDMIKLRDAPTPVVADDGRTPLYRPLRKDEQPVKGAPEGHAPLTTKDVAEEQLELARKKAKKAEKRIYDWMIESQYPAEMRKVIGDGSRIGVGVLKGPFPKIAKNVAVSKEGDGITLQWKESVKPGLRWADPWNIFPDPGCGEAIANGDFVHERDYISGKQVRDLKSEPGYIKSQLDIVLDEGPRGQLDASNKPGEDPEKYKHQFEIWYFYGTISREDMACICQAAGQPLKGADVPYERRDVFAIVTMINDHVVKAAFNPLDSGRFPYRSVPWERRPGHWAGIGVVEQVAAAQRMINAATRAMLNNAGKSAGSQIVINRNQISPANKQWAVTPDKIWYSAGDSQMPIEDAFGMFTVPNVTDHMMTIIQYALRLAEESTNIPLVTQGQSGPTQPDTLGGMQLQNNNANQLLRSVGYAFDDFVTEPLVRDLYEWLLLDPDIPDDEKGDFAINARGSAALVERAIQDQILAQILPSSLQPAFKLDPARTMDEFLKSKRFDPRAFKRDEAEQKKLDEQPPQPLPQVQAAQITAASREKIAESDRTIELSDIKSRERLAILKYANDHQMTVEQVKAKLADTSMKLTVQRELAAAPQPGRNGQVRRVKPQRGGGSQVLTPPTEPRGRARDGQAFIQ